MPNINTLFSSKKSSSNNNNDDSSDNDDSNNRFVGGIDSRGGGSGLAVEPNRNFDGATSSSSSSGGGGIDAIFGRAEQDDGAGSNTNDNSANTVRRTIAMYRDGFVVDDGPYRRLDDPTNADFLRSLAMGRTPRELVEDGGEGSKDVVVGLIDKRTEEFVEVFQSFSGQGTSLGSTAAVSSNGVFDPTSIDRTTTSTVVSGGTITSIAIRLMNGQRKVLKISVNATVHELIVQLITEANLTEPFRLVSGYPPQPIIDTNQTIEDAKLQGSQIQIQKV